MASYHLAVKTVSRSAGRSATAAAAYRSGDLIPDERTGTVHDYRRKQGIEHREIVAPADAPEWASDRISLWNAAEQAETRKNSTVAREFEVALPAELSAEQRKELVLSLAGEIRDRHGVAVDVSIHEPGREGDNRNHHAHLLMTTRRLTPDGLGEKSRELDDKKRGEVEHWRGRWGEMQNHALERAGHSERVDHRSLKRQGIEAEPQVKMGPAVMALERKAEHRAEREGRAYEPVTKVAQHNAAVIEKRGLGQLIERGSAWLKEHGIDVERIVQGAADRILALRDRLGGAKLEPQLSPAGQRLQEKLAQMPDRVRQIEQERTKDRGGPER